MFPKAILFDLDDTIISFEGVSEEAWKKCCSDFINEYLPVCNEQELLSQINTTRKWYWSDPERHKIGRTDMIQARREIVKIALNNLKVYDIIQANSLADSFSAYRVELISLFPNSINTLKYLKSKNIKLGLITNGTSKEQRAKINRFNLNDFFNIILIEHEVGFGKPDLRVYIKALEYFNVESKDVWMVGDNLIWDIQAPQKLGIYSIWNDYQNKGLPKDSQIIPDRIINDISELLK